MHAFIHSFIFKGAGTVGATGVLAPTIPHAETAWVKVAYLFAPTLKIGLCHPDMFNQNGGR